MAPNNADTASRASSAQAGGGRRRRQQQQQQSQQQSTSSTTTAAAAAVAINPLADLGLGLTSANTTTSTPNSNNGNNNNKIAAPITTADTTSVSNSDVASSVSTSRGRRRRRNRKNNGGGALMTSGMQPPAVLPRIQETKPVRLQLGLNLDVELELKAHLEGDVSLSLLAERKYTPRESPELKISKKDGVAKDKDELFHMRLGRINFRQKWIDREVSPSLTFAVAVALVVAGFLVGVVVGRYGLR